ncbi:hypothetical protein IBE97_05855 [Francisella tularensis]|uniref:Uncharacterized protein n=2 Tax=Francisella tularensis subsp. holarctica TaxID=119857 RepID=A0AAI8BJF8_FRATH|nr:hypothetical protein [Francisella tularensis]EBA52146.1 hypothetical protein FTHG_00438 [Francisella tularensis subsp. holarctica 257]ABI82445.1 conserved hypothetical protein [Francisella tularensis subsp. holarctica OSU18]AFT92392.1 hypothetical protein FTS_0461 [Francisella tularensis subsp. holarctica FSC200]AJI50289.1 hypothetical protein DA46_235 [Francisella tularensis subsp. holarctica]AJI60130.1 hypothetical protein AW21_1323 [Francisella tularensis subsp. holarctica LVS]
MPKQVTQKLVNQKCDLLRSQNEEITVSKVRKLIGEGVSIIDLVEKVTLYKEDKKQALEVAEQEILEPNQPVRDELLEIIRASLKQFDVDRDDIAFSLRSDIMQYIQQQISNNISKLKHKQAELSNKNDSLEISNISLDRRYKELLEKYNQIKEEAYSLKQNYNSKSMKFLEKETTEKMLLAWEDFKGIKEQLVSLKMYSKVAAYDKSGVIVIKFPATDFLTQECRAGVSRYLKAKTVFDYSIQAWILSGFKDILKTLDFLQRNKFVFSKELETIAYLRRQKS